VKKESSFTVSHSVRCKAPTANKPFRFKKEKMLTVVDFTSTEGYGG